MRRIAISLALIASMLVAGTQAWWCVGHMVIAEIARQNLEYSVAVKVDEHFQFLNQWFPQTNNMVSGACWADDLKSQQLEVMKGWHFINQPYNPENITIRPWPIQEINVETAITKLGETLQGYDVNMWIRAFAVANLVHFIGDIHQPLHATERFDAEFPHGDFGGNKVHVHWDGKVWPLHNIWDSVCGQYTSEPPRPLSNSSYAWIKSLATQYAENYTVPAYEKSVYNSTIMALESFQAAVKYAYANNTIQPDNTLTQKYIDTCKVVAGYRISYAGFRLAHDLNYIFGSRANVTAKAVLSRVIEVKKEYEHAARSRHHH